MGKKIVVLNGSPRLNGNTAGLIKTFVNGAHESGHSVQVFDLQKMSIHGCTGCLKGGKTPDSPCTQKDDMDKIYPAFKEADIIVLASPMYYWSVTGQLKIVIDRLFAVTEANNHQTPYKECVLLMACEGDDKENFKPVKEYYESLLGFLKWKDLGQVCADGVMEIGEIKNHPALDKAFRLGQSL